MKQSIHKTRIGKLSSLFVDLRLHHASEGILVRLFLIRMIFARGTFQELILGFENLSSTLLR